MCVCERVCLCVCVCVCESCDTVMADLLDTLQHAESDHVMVVCCV